MRACWRGYAAGALPSSTAVTLLSPPPSLASRGFTCFAADCRGHGDSTRSAQALYDVAVQAADLEDLIVDQARVAPARWRVSLTPRQDLYTTPVALVGFGMGAAVAARLAATRPLLVGAVALCELWPAPAADSGFAPGQAGQFASAAQAAAFLAAPCWVRRANRHLP